MCKTVRILLPLLVLVIAIAALGNASGQQAPKGDTPKVPGGDLPKKDMPKPEEPKKDWPDRIDGLTLDQWIDRLKNPDPSTRNAAVRVVPLFGPPAQQKGIPMLLTMMTEDRDLSVRIGALMTCTTHPYDDIKLLRTLIAKLTTLLQSQERAIRFQAAMGCNRIAMVVTEKDKPDLIGRQAIDGLISVLCGSYVLKDNLDYELRTAACVALGQIAADDKRGPNRGAIAALIHAMADEALAVRMEALQALMILGPPKDDKGATSTELTLMQNRLAVEKDKVLAMWIRVCLMRFDKNNITDSNIKAIADYLKDSDEHVQLSAAKALGFMGTTAKGKIPELRACLQNAKGDYVKVMCIFALGQMGPDAVGARPDILPYLESMNPVIKEQAENAIKQIDVVKPKK
jgi:HEAT repeat protein